LLGGRGRNRKYGFFLVYKIYILGLCSQKAIVRLQHREPAIFLHIPHQFYICLILLWQDHRRLTGSYVKAEASFLKRVTKQSTMVKPSAIIQNVLIWFLMTLKKYIHLRVTLPLKENFVPDAREERDKVFLSQNFTNYILSEMCEKWELSPL
jgi:hypothetical protein